MRLSVSSYSYLGAVRAGRMRQIDVIDTAAAQGYQGVEFAVLALEAGQTPLGFAKEAAARARDAGLAVPAYCVGADFLRSDPAAEVQRLKGELQVAAELGARVMRHDASSGFPAGASGPRSFEAALPRLADACRQVAEFAAGLGITTCVENHGYFCQDSARVEALCCAVDHKNFGLLVDMGNFMCADEKSELAVARVAPYAVHVHAKDFFWKDGQSENPGEGWFTTRAGHRLRGAITGHGAVPVGQCLRLMRAAGYDGFVTVEFEGMEEPVAACALARKYMSARIAELG